MECFYPLRSTRMPHGIIGRSKKGFNAPVGYWVNADLKELVNDQLAPDKIEREGYFNADYVQKLLSDHAAGTRDNRKLIWTLLIFELWYERYAG